MSCDCNGSIAVTGHPFESIGIISVLRHSVFSYMTKEPSIVALEIGLLVN